MRLSTRMLLLLVIAVAGVLISAMSSLVMLNKMKVNGPIYKQILQGKDLAADILPPPEYIVESYLILHRLKNESGPAVQRRLIAHFRSLEKEFEDRHKFWNAQLADDDIKKLLIGDVYNTARSFYRHANEVFIPAILRGDSIAATRAINRLEAVYALHRRYIDRLVAMVDKRGAMIEAGAVHSLRSAYVLLGVIYVLVVVAVVILCYFITRSVGRQLGGDPNEVRNIALQVAGGNLTFSDDIYGNRHGSVLWAMKEMVSQLKALIGEKELKNRQLEELSDSLNIKVAEKEKALKQVKQLEGIIPICMYCKKIRNDASVWDQLEAYISEHTNAVFSHGICPDCAKKYHGI